MVFFQNNFTINDSFVSRLVESLNKKTKQEGLRGGKSLYVDWLEEYKDKDVLFVFKKEGFGLAWFVDKLKKTPGTRVPVLKKPKDFKDLLRSFVLQDHVVLLAKQKNLDKDSFFTDQFLNHKKNILYKKYEEFVFKKSGDIDEGQPVDRHKAPQPVGNELTAYVDVNKTRKHRQTEGQRHRNVAPDPLAQQHDIARQRVRQKQFEGPLLLLAANRVENKK